MSRRHCGMCRLVAFEGLGKMTDGLLLQLGSGFDRRLLAGGLSSFGAWDGGVSSVCTAALANSSATPSTHLNNVAR
jgi:hypothetical protein